MSQDKVIQQFEAALQQCEANHEAAVKRIEDKRKTELEAAYQQFEAEFEKEGADYAELEAAYQQFEDEVKAVVTQFYDEVPGARDAMDSFLFPQG